MRHRLNIEQGMGPERMKDAQAGLISDLAANPHLPRLNSLSTTKGKTVRLFILSALAKLFRVRFKVDGRPYGASLPVARDVNCGGSMLAVSNRR